MATSTCYVVAHPLRATSNQVVSAHCVHSKNPNDTVNLYWTLHLNSTLARGIESSSLLTAFQLERPSSRNLPAQVGGLSFSEQATVHDEIVPQSPYLRYEACGGWLDIRDLGAVSRGAPAPSGRRSNSVGFQDHQRGVVMRRRYCACEIRSH
jgi:hypothetical protein